MQNSKLLEKYNDAKAKLTRYKTLEHSLRLELIEELFPNAIEGTHNLEVDNQSVKAVFKMILKLDAKALDETGNALSQAEKACIVYKPSLILAKYNKLEDSEKEALAEMITTSPALPSIKIISSIEE